LKFQIIARSGCSFYPIPLILEEEIIFTIEVDDFKELEKKLKGILLKIEGEDCILFTERSILELEKLLANDENALRRFRKWWEKANIVEIEGEKGKLFIIKKI
jgi:hypothetical protein